ncbi:MAG TPA: hypothetical protein VH008_28910, partial [Pseudonocardia sp.]|nr:hypothetical protein [Pseudonocardia sp.]
LVAAVAEGLLDWRRHRPPVPDQHPDHSHDEQGHVEPGLDPVRYVLAHRADDLGYGAGLWWGALRRRTLAPLRPLITGLGGRSVRARAGEKVHGWLR